jgi:hypothetical protein
LPARGGSIPAERREEKWLASGKREKKKRKKNEPKEKEAAYPRV